MVMEAMKMENESLRSPVKCHDHRDQRLSKVISSTLTTYCRSRFGCSCGSELVCHPLTVATPLAETGCRLHPLVRQK